MYVANNRQNKVTLLVVLTSVFEAAIIDPTHVVFGTH